MPGLSTKLFRGEQVKVHVFVHMAYDSQLPGFRINVDFRGRNGDDGFTGAEVPIPNVPLVGIGPVQVLQLLVNAVPMPKPHPCRDVPEPNLIRGFLKYLGIHAAAGITIHEEAHPPQ